MKKQIFMIFIGTVFLFLIISSVIYGFVSHYFGYSEIDQDFGTNSVLANWFDSHNNYANVILIAFIAISLRFVFYRKQKYNIFEYFILMAFITGEIMVMGIFAEPLSGILHSEIPGDIYLILIHEMQSSEEQLKETLLMHLFKALQLILLNWQ